VSYSLARLQHLVIGEVPLRRRKHTRFEFGLFWASCKQCERWGWFSADGAPFFVFCLNAVFSSLPHDASFVAVEKSIFGLSPPQKWDLLFCHSGMRSSKHPVEQTRRCWGTDLRKNLSRFIVLTVSGGLNLGGIPYW